MSKAPKGSIWVKDLITDKLEQILNEKQRKLIDAVVLDEKEEETGLRNEILDLEYWLAKIKKLK
jgi:hypothetical protein